MMLRAAALRRALGRLRPGDWLEVARAQMALIFARVLLATRPRGRLIDPGAPAPSSADLDPRDLPLARRVALNVERAAEYGLFRPQCLVQALALHRSLERRGVRGSRIRIGVRKREQAFEAHAWVEYAGEVLGDRIERVRQFVQITDARDGQFL